jgi:uncharacterized membrane protein
LKRASSSFRLEGATLFMVTPFAAAQPIEERVVTFRLEGATLVIVTCVAVGRSDR